MIAKLFRTLQTAALAAPVCLALTAPALAQARYGWHYERLVGSSPDQTSLSVMYGVPQTDDYELLARCIWSGGSPQVEVTMIPTEAGVGPGTSTQFSIVSNRGYRDRLDVRVISGQAYGVQFSVAPNDPFLAALRDHGNMGYGLFAGPCGNLSAARQTG